MDISLHQLKLIRELAQRGTIAAAAESLGYTPSAVSQQLSSLEKAVGVPVLERVGRNVRLTDAGRELVKHAEGILSSMEAAQSAVETVANEVQGVLELSVFESVATTLLPELLQRLGAQYPAVSLRTRQMDPDQAIQALGLGQIDLAFTLDYPHAPAEPRTDVVRETIVEDHFHAVVPLDSDLPSTVALSALAEERFIASPVDLSCGRCVLVACREAGFEPDVVHQLDDYPTTLHLIEARQGIGLLPDLGLVIRPPGIRVLNLDPPFLRTVQLAYRKVSAERPAIKAVRKLLHEVVLDTLDRPAAKSA